MNQKTVKLLRKTAALRGVPLRVAKRNWKRMNRHERAKARVELTNEIESYD